MKGKLRRVLSLMLCAVIAFGGWTIKADAAERSTSISVYTEVVTHQADAREVLNLVNQEREKVGAAPLVMTEELEKIAIMRAAELTALFSHTRPDGRTCFSMADDYGLFSWTSGENIAMGPGAASGVMDLWMGSEGHRGNILNSAYTHIGIARVQYGGNNYWVQYFAKDPAPATPAAASAGNNETFSAEYRIDPEVVTDCSVWFAEDSVSLEFGGETALDVRVAGGGLDFLGSVSQLPQLVASGNLEIPEDAPLTVTDDGMIKAGESGKFGTYTITFRVGNLSASKTITVSCSHPVSEQTTEKVDPACGTDGYERVKCTLCGEVLSEKVLPMAQEHSMSEWVTVTEPDCTNAGLKKGRCENCGYEGTEVIPAVGHTAGDWEITKEATCTEKGEQIQKCTVCGDVVATKEIPMKEHAYGEWIVVKEATVSEVGESQRVCADCGYVDKMATDKLPAQLLPTETINSVVSTINGAAAGENITVAMGGATVVPKAILEEAKGKDVNIVLDMGGYTWTINGMDILASDLRDINLEVKFDTNAIPGNVVKAMAGENPVRQISLTHNGDFGFKATLTMNAGAEYSGKYGNLYYYDSNGKMVFIDAGTIDESGNVSLEFSHASDYLLVMSDQQMSQADVPDELQPQGEGTGANANGVKTGDETNAVLYLVLMILCAGVVGTIVLRKKYFTK